MTTLVVGRGLLGGTSSRCLAELPGGVRTVDVPWADPDAALAALLEAAAAIGRGGPERRIAWCAGAGVVATRPEVSPPRCELLRRVASWRPARAERACSWRRRPAASTPGPPTRPLRESTAAAHPSPPTAGAKLAMEDSAAPSRSAGARRARGRFSNLYGPGQDLCQAPGSDLAALPGPPDRPAVALRALDTLRDYLFVDDAAALAVAGLQPGVHRPRRGP